MQPYYESEGITLYLGDCREILPTLDIRPYLLLTDPPYGIATQTDNKRRGRGFIAECNDYPAVYGDDVPFDPKHLLVYPRIILFGANYYAHKLPCSPSWLIWDKLDGLESSRELGFNDSADVEMAWTNLGGAAKLVPHRWMGAMKGSERASRRVHPTQKPIVLMRHIIEYFTNVGSLVLDPYCGAGSTLIAAKQSGRRAVGIEIEEAYCAVTAQRLGNM